MKARCQAGREAYAKPIATCRSSLFGRIYCAPRIFDDLHHVRPAHPHVNHTMISTTETWTPLGPLSEAITDFSKYYKDIGVYRAILNNEIMYIGKTTELLNGGFRKRLRDYTRTSDSARNYPSGRLMHHHRNEVCIEILIFNRDCPLGI